MWLICFCVNHFRIAQWCQQDSRMIPTGYHNDANNLFITNIFLPSVLHTSHTCISYINIINIKQSSTVSTDSSRQNYNRRIISMDVMVSDAVQDNLCQCLDNLRWHPIHNPCYYDYIIDLYDFTMMLLFVYKYDKRFL